MIGFNTLYNFISPVTGRLLADHNYVLVGNREGIATPSPMLIDIRLDLIGLQRKISNINNANFILSTANLGLPNAQALDNLSYGFLYNTAGTLSAYNIIPLNNLTDLKFGKIFIGDENNRPTIGLPPEGPRGPKGPKGFSGTNQIGPSGLAGLTGATGFAGLAGRSGKVGVKGAAGDSGVSTLDITTNYDMSGNSIDNISQSPGGDYDAISAKWFWDLIHDNVVNNF